MSWKEAAQNVILELQAQIDDLYDDIEVMKDIIESDDKELFEAMTDPLEDD